MAIVRRSTRTVKVAELLGTLPALFATTTANFAPSSAPIVAGVVYVAEVAPATAAPFLLHWYERGAVPVAVTLNVAVAGAATAWFCGWGGIDGGETGRGGDRRGEDGWWRQIAPATSTTASDEDRDADCCCRVNDREPHLCA